jgi:membrane protein
MNVLSRRKAFWIRQLKVLLIALRELNNDRIAVQASSLSFYLLLSIVPIAAFIFAVSSGFGIEVQLKNWLGETFPDQQDVVSQILQFADSALNNAHGGWIAGIGIVMLLWSSLSMFVRIEEALNSIWQSHSRTWKRRFADYLSFMLVAPVLLILSNSITVTFRYYLNAVTEFLPFVGTVTPALFTILPVILIWILFALIYIVMPNVRVHVVPALFSAIIAGTTFYFVEQLYIYSQVSISKYSAIYGSMAAIPLFLLCARFGWQILLFGAELSFAYQNIDIYELDTLERKHICHYNFSILSILVLKKISDLFKTGDAPKPVSKLSEELGISVRSLNLVIEALLDCGLIVEVNSSNHRDSAYMPAMDVHKITAGMALNRLEHQGKTVKIDKPDSDELLRITALVKNVYKHSDIENELKIIDL